MTTVATVSGRSNPANLRNPASHSDAVSFRKPAKRSDVDGLRMAEGLCARTTLVMPDPTHHSSGRFPKILNDLRGAVIVEDIARILGVIFQDQSTDLTPYT